MSLFQKLDGFKTYAVCAVSVVYALSALATGHMDADTAFQTVSAALGAASMRHAIAKATF